MFNSETPTAKPVAPGAIKYSKSTAPSYGGSANKAVRWHKAQVLFPSNYYVCINVITFKMSISEAELLLNITICISKWKQRRSKNTLQDIK